MKTMLSPLDIQDELKDYKRPDVYHGELVRWHPTGVPGGADPLVAVVQRIKNNHNVDLFVLAANIVKEGVSHISDPRLKLGSDHRESGAFEKIVDPRIEALEKKVAELTGTQVRRGPGRPRKDESLNVG